MFIMAAVLGRWAASAIGGASVLAGLAVARPFTVTHALLAAPRPAPARQARGAPDQARQARGAPYRACCAAPSGILGRGGETERAHRGAMPAVHGA